MNPWDTAIQVHCCLQGEGRRYLFSCSRDTPSEGEQRFTIGKQVDSGGIDDSLVFGLGSTRK